MKLYSDNKANEHILHLTNEELKQMYRMLVDAHILMMDYRDSMNEDTIGYKQANEHIASLRDLLKACRA